MLRLAMRSPAPAAAALAFSTTWRALVTTCSVMPINSRYLGSCCWLRSAAVMRWIVVDKRSEYSERSGGRGVCFGGGNRGGFGANQIVYGAECGGGSALHRSLND